MADSAEKKFNKKAHTQGKPQGNNKFAGKPGKFNNGGNKMKRKRSDGDFEKNGPSPKKQRGEDGERFDKDDVEKRGIKRKASDNVGDQKRIDKREQKRLKREKKMKRPNAEMVYNAKVMWEEIRQKKTSDTKRNKNIDQLLDLIRGKMFEVVMKRDTSRVIQSVLKLGSTEQRQVVFEELKEHIIAMAQNNYAHFIINKMLKYGDKEQVNLVIKQFYGKVRKLAKHKEASQVVEYIYNECANSQQRSALIEEFYGPEFSLFKSDEKRSLESILEKDPQKKRGIVLALKEYLIDITNKAHAVLGHGIVHVPLLKFFEIASYTDINEFLPFIRDHIVRILHTREGSKVACHVLGYGKAKDRKTIIKSFKSYVAKICKEEFGHVVLLKAFECVDDTTLINKVIISEMTESLLEIVKDKYGRLVVFAAIETPSSKYFHSSTLDILKPTMVPDEADSTKLVPSGKKEESVRRSELRSAMFPPLVELAQKSSYDMITDMFARNVLEEVYIQSKDEETRERFNASILQWVNRPQDDEPIEKKDERKYHPMEQKPKEEEAKVDILRHTLAHRIVRRLIEEDSSFASRLLNKIKSNIADYCFEKSSSWVIISLLEKEDTAQNTKKLLAPFMTQLQEASEVGAKVLYEKLTGKAPATPSKKDESLGKSTEAPNSKKADDIPKKAEAKAAKDDAKKTPAYASNKNEKGDASEGSETPKVQKPKPTSPVTIQSQKPKSDDKKASPSAQSKSDTKSKPSAENVHAAVQKSPKDKSEKPKEVTQSKASPTDKAHKKEDMKSASITPKSHSAPAQPKAKPSEKKGDEQKLQAKKHA